MVVDSALIALLIKDVVIPEIMVAIRAHQAATGNLPTDEQVISAMNLDADQAIAVGQAFLNRINSSNPTPAVSGGQ